MLEKLLLTAIFTIAAASAQAQVAVSEMVPAAPRIIDPTEVVPTASFVTPNPAAMQWGAPSRWGGGTLSSEREQTAPTTGTPVEFGGIYAGARVLGKNLTVAGYMLELGDDTNTFSLEADWNVLAGGVAFQSGDNITFGVSMERADNTVSGVSLDFNTINLGLSVKASDKIYLGLALGTEDINVASESGDRSVQKYGVGYRAGGQSQTHFEAYIVDREANDQFSAGAFSDSNEKVLVAEVILGSIFLGASLSNTTQDRNDQEINALIFDIGWAPKNGLALLFHRESATTESGVSTTSPTEDDTSTTAISIAWSF
jgi:hypothetical protein